ncbi:uncharacterized protein LOC129767256 [Toxorhynchites rutilus septentrionalis]|uniref:uncharacterized protein LOC129767256 n=1 Tax=Toxorhynchites rutilus septentrionalis TaxID=329112 RepID=UPI00247848AC|nr:uncharacterized protein LOC129767256 [Toxorhynchites rutilus septentrionalis]
MLPQLTVYAKILCLLMVVIIAGATPDYMYLQSDCSSKFVRIVAKNGTVFADDNGQSGRPQTFTIEPFSLPKKNLTIGVAIRCEETDMYLCFDKNWKIKGMKNRGNIVSRSRCHFYEKLERGYFRYQSVINQTKYLGFVGSGKPINYKLKRVINEKCYNFQRTNASGLFFENKHQNTGTVEVPPHPHRHKHGSGDQRRTRGKFHSPHRSQNLAEQGPSSSSQKAMQSHTLSVTTSGSRFIDHPIPSHRTTQMSNDVHTTTQKPAKTVRTKKQAKPSKRPGKLNKKAIMYGTVQFGENGRPQ